MANVSAPAPISASTPQNFYAVRIINLMFNLTNGGTLNLQATSNSIGFRVIVDVELANAPTTGSAHIRAYGMSLDHMNLLTRAGLLYKVSQANTVTVQAGDSSGMVTVFTGIIIQAYPDMRGQPEVSFYIYATPTQLTQLKNVPAISFNGGTTVVAALMAIIKPAGWKLEDNGVKATLASPYFSGTTWDQVLKVTQTTNLGDPSNAFFITFDGLTNTLAIWPKTGSRSSGGVPLIAPETGMINYPEFEAVQVRVRTLLNPAIQGPGVGQKFQVQSQTEGG